MKKVARRIKSRKRKHLGNRFFGGGNAKNRRGKGNKGGKGNAGHHKHNWLRTIKLGLYKHRKYGFFSHAKKLSTVTLEELVKEIAAGKYSQEAGAYNIVLRDAKVVGSSEFPFKAVVSASAFSEGAAKRIEAAGGSAKTAAHSGGKPSAPPGQATQ